jgi:hypothetical protein
LGKENPRTHRKPLQASIFPWVAGAGILVEAMTQSRKILIFKNSEK